MYAVLRAVPVALASLWAVVPIRGQLPPIFAPNPPSSAAKPPLYSPPPATAAPVSQRVRTLINAAATRVLEEAAVFDAPRPADGAFVDPATGVTVMTPMIVKGESLKEWEVRPPSLRLFHFSPRDVDKDRRLDSGYMATLYQTFIGNKEMRVEFSIVKGAGKGMDHNQDFTRAELGFSFRW
jgi:hypothetical protein